MSMPARFAALRIAAFSRADSRICIWQVFAVVRTVKACTTRPLNVNTIVLTIDLRRGEDQDRSIRKRFSIFPRVRAGGRSASGVRPSSGRFYGGPKGIRTPVAGVKGRAGR